MGRFPKMFNPFEDLTLE